MTQFNSEEYSGDMNCVSFHMCGIFDDVDELTWAHEQPVTSVMDSHAPRSTDVSNVFDASERHPPEEYVAFEAFRGETEYYRQRKICLLSQRNSEIYKVVRKYLFQ